MIDVLFFIQGEDKKIITLDVLRDDVPEVNEEYQLNLANVQTTGKLERDFRSWFEFVNFFFLLIIND